MDDVDCLPRRIELRQPYDRLLLKVLSLLQDGDPELAREIVASREAMWGILADPVKFATSTYERRRLVPRRKRVPEWLSARKGLL